MLIIYCVKKIWIWKVKHRLIINEHFSSIHDSVWYSWLSPLHDTYIYHDVNFLFIIYIYIRLSGRSGLWRVNYPKNDKGAFVFSSL